MTTDYLARLREAEDIPNTFYVKVDCDVFAALLDVARAAHDQIHSWVPLAEAEKAGGVTLRYNRLNATAITSVADALAALRVDCASSSRRASGATSRTGTSSR